MFSCKHLRRIFRLDYTECADCGVALDVRVLCEERAGLMDDLARARLDALKEVEQIVRDAIETHSVHASPNAILNAFYGGQLDAATEILNKITALKTGVGLHASQQPHATDAATAPRG